jgi:hypothetical protein
MTGSRTRVAYNRIFRTNNAYTTKADRLFAIHLSSDDPDLFIAGAIIVVLAIKCAKLGRAYQTGGWIPRWGTVNSRRVELKSGS